MTLTNVEKELIATQVYKLEESYQKLLNCETSSQKTYLEYVGEVWAIINELKRYWIDQQ